jgi:hypothetical protein
MKQTIVILSFIFPPFFVSAQEGNTEQQAAINKLQWMTGSWTGSSLLQFESKKVFTNIRETVQPALDGTILLINVKATDRDTTTNRQSIAYTSFSVISYDTKNKKYRWTTWRNSGSEYDEHPFTVGDNSFEYTSNENGGTVRYKASTGSKGEFLETGEYSKDGTTWEQFITMKLLKTKENKSHSGLFPLY